MKDKYGKHCEKIRKINDPRIVGYTNRTRAGATQEFYTGNDARDWDRYRAEGGNSAHGVEMHLKADTIHIQPPEKHWYAELIDGEWWWVNGCAECVGQPRSWGTYIECDKHNVCRTCGCGRSELTEPPWGGANGWQCKPCAEKEHEAEKATALAAMPEEYDEWDYYHNSEIKCPYCDHTINDDGEYADADNEDIECPRCDNTFTVTAEISVDYTTKRKE